MARKRLTVGTFRTLPGGPWEIEITDRRLLVSTLGDSLIVAFCRCFVHADRLTALTSFGALSVNAHGENSVAHERNLQTMFWFVTGTFLELQPAINGLTRELRRAGLLTPRLRGWAALKEVQGWSRGPLLRRLRNKVVFHVDEPEVRAGVMALAAGKERWLLARGDDRRMMTAQIPFGMEALLKGLTISRADAHNFIRSAAKRQRRVPAALQEMFLAVLRRKGLTLRR